ncbi:hypothetical protein KIM372_05950 [Bombiscardovia nodaiensis]|uniref:Uncharacterized protein n=1 Tax=Bombiscardovia nodaiensis TaxID=2932181 RepID=A0ABN6SB60_9BIFI|nr:hypothetical protein KIM372_05950 [Bombiscardovia nodaiensis]
MMSAPPVYPAQFPLRPRLCLDLAANESVEALSPSAAQQRTYASYYALHIGHTPPMPAAAKVDRLELRQVEEAVAAFRA